MEDSIANGAGSIKFKKSNTLYKGSFKGGLYDTAGMGPSYY
jgi:hypothetical protein